MKKLLITVVTIVTIFTTWEICSAKDYYISNDKTDSLYVVNQIPLQPNDRVFFKRGDTFNGRLILKSGSKGKYILYSSYGTGALPILTTDKHEDIIDGSPEWVIISKLHITGGSRHGIGMDGGTNNIIITNCIISNMGGGRDNPNSERLGNGIELWRGAENIIVANNIIYNIYDAGITNQGLTNKEMGQSEYTQSNIVFVNNYIGKAQYGYEFFSSPYATIKDITVYNNFFDMREDSYKVELRKWNIQRAYQLWDSPEDVDIKFINNTVKERKHE